MQRGTKNYLINYNKMFGSMFGMWNIKNYTDQQIEDAINTQGGIVGCAYVWFGYESPAYKNPVDYPNALPPNHYAQAEIVEHLKWYHDASGALDKTTLKLLEGIYGNTGNLLPTPKPKK